MRLAVKKFHRSKRGRAIARKAMVWYHEEFLPAEAKEKSRNAKRRHRREGRTTGRVVTVRSLRELMLSRAGV